MAKNVKITIETKEGTETHECDSFLLGLIDHIEEPTPENPTDLSILTLGYELNYIDSCRATSTMSAAMHKHFIGH